MICKYCGNEYAGRTVGFNAICERCNEYLHSCFNCALYDSNADRCRSLTTETVSDRKSSNYCEEFVPNSDSISDRIADESKSAVDFNSIFGTDGE